MTYLVAGLHGLVAAVFGVAATGKAAPSSFAGFVTSTGHLLPHRWWQWRRPVAVLVLSAELATVGLVVVGLAVVPVAAAGFGLAVALSGGFAAGMVGALRRGQRAPCRCFGASATPLGPVHVVRNGLLGTAAAVGLVATLAGPAGSAHPAGVVVAVAAGLVAAVVLVVRLDDMVALFAPMSSMEKDWPEKER